MSSFNFFLRELVQFGFSTDISDLVLPPSLVRSLTLVGSERGGNGGGTRQSRNDFYIALLSLWKNRRRRDSGL